MVSGTRFQQLLGPLSLRSPRSGSDEEAIGAAAGSATAFPVLRRRQSPCKSLRRQQKAPVLSPQIRKACYRMSYLWLVLSWAGMAGIFVLKTSSYIGFRARIVSVASLLFPLIDTSFSNHPELLARARRRLDMTGRLHTAPPISSTADYLFPSSKTDQTIPVRIFRPIGVARDRTLVWIHGGGWTLGSLESDDAICRRLAAATHSTVVSVEYRLAPEHKWPAPLEDSLSVIRHVLEYGNKYNLSSNNVAVLGESAGGHLSIASVLALQGSQERLCGVVPIVPATDYGCQSASCHKFSHGYLLTQAQVRAFWHATLEDPSTQRHDFFVSPLRTPPDVLRAQLPPMLLVTAALDPLHDEGEAFARKAQQAGILDVQLLRMERTIHGFFGRWCTQSEAGMKAVAQWIEGAC